MIEISTDTIILIARFCLSAVFLVSGIHKAIYFQAGQAEFRAVKLPFPDICLVLVIALHLLASVSLITGVYAVASASALAGFLIIVSGWVHDFWNKPAGEERVAASRDFLANLAILGGLLMVVAVGPGGHVIG